MKMRRALFILATATAATSIYADKVQLSQTPPAVQQAIRSRSGRHTVEDIDRDVKNGQTTYEASWKDKSGAQQELLLSDNGTILRDVASGTNRNAFRRLGGTAAASTTVTNSVAGFTGGQQAPLNWASETAQSSLKTMTGGAQVDNFQKGQFQGKTAYQASFKTNGQTMTIVMGEDGKLLATSPAAGSVATTTPITPGTIYPGFSNAQAAPMNWASETVQNKVRQLANGAPIQNFQKGQYQGKTAYLSTFIQNGSISTVVLGEDGTVLSATPTAAGSPAPTATGAASGRK